MHNFLWSYLCIIFLWSYLCMNFYGHTFAWISMVIPLHEFLWSYLCMNFYGHTFAWISMVIPLHEFLWSYLCMNFYGHTFAWISMAIPLHEFFMVIPLHKFFSSNLSLPPNFSSQNWWCRRNYRNFLNKVKKKNHQNVSFIPCPRLIINLTVYLRIYSSVHT